jgi:TP901 family phage tail tape measure protein
MAAPGRVFAINLLADSKPAEKAFKKVGQSAGRLKTPMGVAAASITAVFAAVTAVAVKSFKALLDLGEEFNEVTRIISVGTGAVGGDLEALEQSFRDVAASVPNAFADIATVVAELDTRTDLAGDGLEMMAEQLLTLSRLMGGDARSTTREVTRLFNRFGLSAEEASDMLDVLFRASQASGAEVDSLASDVTKNAGALIEMGFSLEESVALFALFEREGIRSQTVVRSLRSGFRRLTEDGTPLRDALADVFEELQTLDRTAAVSKGLEIFGSQALDLVDAVRDGRLSVEDFTQQIVDGEAGIIDTAEATDGWRTKLDELKNFLKLEFEEVAREVFKNVTEFVDELKPAAQRVSDAFEEDGLQGALEQIAIEWDKIYEERIQPLFLRFLEFLQDTVKPVALTIGEEIGGAIASGMWSAFKAGVSNLFGSRMGERILGDDFDNFELAPGPGFDLSSLVPDLPSMGGEVDDFTPPPRPDRDRRRTPPPPPPPPVRGLPRLPGGLNWGSGGLPVIPGMANGGFVDSPTLALIGEAGPEMVVPLDRMGGMGSTINITVTSADPQAVVEALRRYTRQNGALSQVVTV